MRFSNAVLGIVCGLMSFFCGMAWLNNVYLSWIKRIWRMDQEIAAQTTGLFPFLDVFAIDHSTVSTFIPFFGLAWAAWGFYRIYRHTEKKVKIDVGKEFPFFSGYNEWMVSLGLMGTVWGLIMIGYLPNLEHLKITDLIGALRTALFSTLAALVWVYIFVLRIIRPGMQFLAEKYVGPAEPSPTVASLQTAIETFAANLERLNSVIAESTHVVDEFRKKATVENMEKVETLITTCIETLPNIKESCDQQTETLKEARTLLDEQLAVSRQNSSQLESIAKSQADRGQNLAAIKDSLNQRDDRDAKNRERLGKIVDVFKKYSEE